VLTHPQVAAVECRDCREHLYDVDEKGRWPVGPKRRPDGSKYRRPAGTVPPCCHCPKIQPGDEPVPENAVELSARNVRAWLFDRECVAVNDWPADAIVRRNAAIIRDVERALTTGRALILLTGIAARLGVK
jgi:hypothetical protein